MQQFFKAGAITREHRSSYKNEMNIFPAPVTFIIATK